MGKIKIKLKKGKINDLMVKNLNQLKQFFMQLLFPYLYLIMNGKL